MPSVLVLSASTGQGHNQAASSLKAELETYGYKVIIAEPVKEAGQLMDLLVEKGTGILETKLPKIYGKLYKMTENTMINKSVASLIKVALSNTVMHLIDEHKPDLLVTTHPLLVNVVSSLKTKGKTDLPFIAVVTDYIAHPFYVNRFVDAYIVGSKYTRETLISKEISEDKIFTSGIPVSKEFRQRIPVNRESVFSILLMGGSMGMPSIKKCLKQLLLNRHHLKIVVVCGYNDKLKNELERKYSTVADNKDLVIYGYTNEIPMLMDKSDLLITKPGGLTVTEAINKNIPMVIPFLLPGQEEENADILVRAGVAAMVSDISELNRVIDDLYENPAQLENMRQKAREISRELTPDCIIQIADRLLYKQADPYKREHSGMNA